MFKIEEIFKEIEKVNCQIISLEKEVIELRSRFDETELGIQAKRKKIYMVFPEQFCIYDKIRYLKEEALKRLFFKAYEIIEKHKALYEYELVKKYYTKLIEYGDSEASFRMGILYEGSMYDGDFFEKDYELALKYYKVSASLENSGAMVNIGRMYGKGIGVEIDHEISIKWYLKAAKLLDSAACLNIAAKYINGTGVDKNYSVAGMWMRLSLIFDNFPSDRQRDISVKTINQSFDHFSEEEKKVSVKLLSEYLIKNNLDEIHSKFFKN